MCIRDRLREAGIEAPASTAAFVQAASELVDQPELTSLNRLRHIVLAEINLYEQLSLIHI